MDKDEETDEEEEEDDAEGEEKERKKSRVEDGGKGESTMTEYERRRAIRIKQNAERMKALNLPSLVSSLKKGFDEETKGKSKASRVTTKGRDDGEEDYQPTCEEEEEEEDDDDDDENDDDYNRSRAKKKKAMRIPKKMRARTCQQSLGDVEVGDDVDLDENAALQKAITLSLGGVIEPSSMMGSSRHTSPKKKEPEAGPSARKKVQRGTGRTKGRTTKNSSRPKMSEDDVVGYFYSIDATGKGSITSWDIKKAVKDHDFLWTDKEISDMICPFDSNRDGKLSLEDFRRVVEQCGMIQTADCEL